MQSTLPTNLPRNACLHCDIHMGILFRESINENNLLLY